MLRWCMLFLFWGSGFHSHAAEPKLKRPTLDFELSVNPNSEPGLSGVRAMTSVLDSMGYNSLYTHFPIKRGLQEIKQGRLDGSIGRVANLSQLLDKPDLLRIDFPLVNLTYSRWCRKGVSAGDSSIRVGSLLGAAVVTMMEPQLSSPRVHLHAMSDSRGSISMLKARRLDCLLSSELHLTADGIALESLKEFDRFDLITFQAFPWIRDKHKGLKPKIEAGLRAYRFPEAFVKTYQNDWRACEQSLNILCPDGILFLKRVDFRAAVSASTN